MAWDGNGLFVRLYNWVTDRDASINITASRMDAEMDGMATGITACINKNGENTPTTNLPMGGFRHTGVGLSSARTMYARTDQLQDSTVTHGTESGAADAYVLTLSPSITAYAAGQRFTFVATNTNTGASTLNVSSVGAQTITTIFGTALPAGAIVSGDLVDVIYDGTNFVLMSWLPDADLSAIAGLTSAANKLIRYTGSGTADLIDFLDEDDMSSDSATAVPSQQSVKAYTDTLIGFWTDSGSADAYTLTTAHGNGLPSYRNGQEVRFIAANASTGGAVTVNIDSVGASTIVLPGGGNPASGDISTSTVNTIRYDLGNTRWELQNADSVLETNIFPAFSNAGSGYIQFKNGLIIQWGISSTLTNQATQDITLPVTFSSAFYAAFSTPYITTTSGGNESSSVFRASNSSVRVLNTGNGASFPIQWLAIGV